jgi:hypothetical protein
MQILAEGSDLYIVTHRDRDTEMFPENVPEGHIFHPQIRSIDHDPSFSIDLSGSADTDGGKRCLSG